MPSQDSYVKYYSLADNKGVSILVVLQAKYLKN